MSQASWALVTGASGGLGYEIALLLAKKGWNLILAARTKSKLCSLKELLVPLCKNAPHIIESDLSAHGSAEHLFRTCKALKDDSGNDIVVSLLVNNAAQGSFGESVESSVQSLLHLNMISLTELCSLFGKDMKAARHGAILNIGSITANQPTPYFASYGASKAYVRLYSLALRQELAPYNVHVTCVEPGYIRTSFDDNSHITSERYKRFAYNIGLSPKRTAKIAVRAAQKSKALVTAGFFNSLSALFTRFLPLPFLAFALAKSTLLLTKE